METESKHIKNFELVDKFNKILSFQITIPPIVYIIILLLQFVIIKSVSFLALIVLIPLGFVILTAIIFTPWLLYVLVKEKHYGWITTFFVIVILPYLIVYPIVKDSIFLLPWMIALIIPFYLYCGIIKYAVNDWVKEYNIEIKRNEDKKEWEEKKKDWLI